MKLRTEFQKEYYPQVIEIYQRTGYSGYKIAKMKLLPVSKSVMCEWIANYEASKGNGSKRRIMEAKKEQAEAEVEALKSRISDLEEALRIERLRNQLNEKSLISRSSAGILKSEKKLAPSSKRPACKFCHHM